MPAPDDQAFSQTLKAFARKQAQSIEQAHRDSPGLTIGADHRADKDRERINKLYAKAAQANSGQWTEYRGNDGKTTVRFANGTCADYGPPPEQQHKHLNSTIKITGCPD
jgi:hypothetical protein